MKSTFVERRFNQQCYDYLGLDIESGITNQDKTITALVQLVAVQDAMIHLMAHKLGIDADPLADGARLNVAGNYTVLTPDGQSLVTIRFPAE